MRHVALCLTPLLLLGCVGSDPEAEPADSEPRYEVDVVGLDPEDGSHILADAICTFEAQCPQVDVECSVMADNALSCEATAKTTVMEQCVMEATKESRMALECANGDQAIEQDISDCASTLVTQDCKTTYSQDELDAIARAVEAGDPPPRNGEEPASCKALEVTCGIMMM